MDQRHDNINFKAHILEEGIMSGGWGRASLPAQIIAIFQGHLSQWVKGTYSKEVSVLGFPAFAWLIYLLEWVPRCAQAWGTVTLWPLPGPNAWIG